MSEKRLRDAFPKIGVEEVDRQIDEVFSDGGVGDLSRSQFGNRVKSKARGNQLLSDDPLGSALVVANATSQAEQIHQSRSSQARSQDERRSAPIADSVEEWRRNKGSLDYPGVDTVEPQALHEQRSQTAQRVDERERAPVTDDKEEWAQNPDQFDYAGVDTPSSGGLLGGSFESAGMQAGGFDFSLNFGAGSGGDDGFEDLL